MTGPPDPCDAALSAVHTAVDNLGPWLAIWQDRHEPDAFARRCASDAIGAADTAIRELHGFRAELVTQVRQADDQAALRADELIGRTRDGPQPGSHAPPAGDHRTGTSASPRPQPAGLILDEATGSGQVPGEVTP
jgi:hypothetical protein